MTLFAIVLHFPYVCLPSTTADSNGRSLDSLITMHFLGNFCMPLKTFKCFNDDQNVGQEPENNWDFFSGRVLSS